MTVRWDKTRGGDREMRLCVRIPDRPGAPTAMPACLTEPLTRGLPA